MQEYISIRIFVIIVFVHPWKTTKNATPFYLSGNNDMDERQKSLILNSSSRFPPSQGSTSQFRFLFSFSQLFHLGKLVLIPFQFIAGVRLLYGTAGFRADALLLESTVFRAGILAALRSLKTHSVIGLMITASHNKVSDNGIKVADPSGGMLTQDWEPFADAIANAATPEHLVQVSNV